MPSHTVMERLKRAQERRAGMTAPESLDAPDLSESSMPELDEPMTLTLDRAQFEELEADQEGDPVEMMVRGVVESADDGAVRVRFTHGNVVHGKKPPLGSGERFRALKEKLSRRPGVTDPGALAAAIGRKRLGKKRFQELAARGRRRA